MDSERILSRTVVRLIILLIYSSSSFTEYYERNRKSLEEKELLYKKRQTIVEHPFGTIKRQWGFNHILTKRGMNRASSDVGLVFIANNLRRIINILTRDQLQKYLKMFFPLFSDINDRIRVNLNQFKPSEYLKWIMHYKNYPLLTAA